MPYKNKQDRMANDVKRYNGKKAYYQKNFQGWKLKNPKRYAFLGQRHSSNQRGVEFNLTFKEWEDFWGDRFWKRGREPNDLVMGRYGDVGAYEIGNIYITTGKENAKGALFKPEL